MLDKKTKGAKLSPKAKKYLENWQRAVAELENLQKRTMKEKETFGRHLTRELVLDLLPVLDNFERALEHVPADNQAENWLVGITYIQKQLVEALAAHGVEKKELKPGDQFDEQSQHAVERQASDAIPQDKIIKVISPAYTLGGEVIRPATVIVSAGADKK